MPLATGSRLGAYEIVSPLGAGGMGEVYRARDLKLRREVALKVLPESFATDADRLARFRREAQLLAALNHSNIAGIYGFEEADGVHALVLELVEGPTLADRIAQGPIPLEEALPIARQIADALETAHEQGIIHRDLKPANIKVRPDGAVKVLDFGLAKAVEPGGVAPNVSQSPTITTPAMMTGVGMILGTAAYMSPEQAKGRPADKRSDIWAFGCVLYEMLTGTRAFESDDVVEILAAVLKSEVDWLRLPPNTPPNIRTLLRRCLRKDSRQRLGDAGAARIEIDEGLAAPEPPRTVPVPLWRTPVPLVAAALVGLAAALVALAIGFRLRNSSFQQPTFGLARVQVPLASGAELAEGASVVISPDGTQVAYVASRGTRPQLYIRPMSAPDARAIAGTQGAVNPFFSPDGGWLAFFADGKLKKVSTNGGVVRTLAEARDGQATGTWGSENTIVFVGPDRTLLTVPSEGGTAHPLVKSNEHFVRSEASRVAYPELLPGREALLITSSTGASSADERSIEVLNVKTGETKVLIQGGSAARYLPTGHVVFQRSGTLMAAAFDVSRLELTSQPVSVIEGLRQGFSGVGAFSCSAGGACVYVPGNANNERTATLVDRNGTSRTLSLPPNSYAQPRFSPTGETVSFWLAQLRCDIEIYDLGRGAVSRLTSEGDNHNPIWTPDGRRITYLLNDPRRRQLLWKPADGSGSAEPLTSAPLNLGATAGLSWSPDGSTLAFESVGDIWVLPLSGGRDPRPFVQSRFNEMMPAFSPDGRWLAYVSDESGSSEVYVQPFPGRGEKYPISTGGGTEPVWARSGRELFFRNGDQMLTVAVSTQSTFSAGQPRLLFSGPFAQSQVGGGGRSAEYDVSPDGEHFLMLTSNAQRNGTQISLMLNWFEEVKARVPTK